MNPILLYGSRYGSARRYAEELGRQLAVTPLPFSQAPALSSYDTIVYLGSLYAGGVLGLAKTFRRVSLRPGQRLILVTVGLANPAHGETRAHIRAGLKGQLSQDLLDQAKVFHLRGGIDYSRLSLPHRAMMGMLHQKLKRTAPEALTEDDRALLATYGKKVDFVDLRALAPVLAEVQKGGTSQK